MSRHDDVNTRIFCELMIFQTSFDFPRVSDSLFAHLRRRNFSWLTRSAVELILYSVIWKSFPPFRETC